MPLPLPGPFLGLPPVHDNACLTHVTCIYMPNRVTGIYRVKNQHVKSLWEMAETEKIAFCPQPREEEKKYETCSHVQNVDGLPPPTVWDARKSAAEARKVGAAQDVPQSLPDPELKLLMDCSGCKNIGIVKVLCLEHERKA